MQVVAYIARGTRMHFRMRTCGSGATLPCMPRTNQDGKDIRLVLEWLCGTVLTDRQLATALGQPTTTYGRRKNDDDFPNFEECEVFANYFSTYRPNLSPRVLQIAFGHLGPEVIQLLNEDEIEQYVTQGGEVPFFRPRGKGIAKVECIPSATASPRIRRRRRRHNAPPG